ncbi:MAG: 1-(5-phosphoribosyl)-5-[(5-phosphoribosylamino)methylideneamino]imidazole-4-carboxamide isomerase [Methanomicrobiales archaeon]|nr:1-(5-phosphoribosyl)-5-[(5-phosphoribosylamino)methylideneamino]imidazole-4-carboxamide isomerase [Methanomicrobiales archaeon]
MDVLPAVDILGGNCVQLVQGERESATLYGSPRSCADRWVREGASALHIVNLDGAFGQSGANATLVREIVHDTGVTVQLGGGIRSREDARGWLDTGVDRVILGTLAVRDPSAVTDIANEFGKDCVMAGVDTRGGQVVIEGWREAQGDYLAWARRFASGGAGGLLFTNVDVEGLQSGIVITPIQEIIREVKIPVTVAGGISSPADVTLIRETGAAAVVLGSALYSGKITLRSAMEAAQ